jgi:hypothetical protein
MAQPSRPPTTPGEDAAEPERASGVAARPASGEGGARPRLSSWLPGLPSRARRVDTLRRVLAPLLLAAVPLYWVLDATHRASLTTLGRDQGIFQYIAWAVGQGEVDYRDIRDVNGPLVHLLHMALLALGGADEHRFHVLELGVTSAVFAYVGWCLPGLLGQQSVTHVTRVTRVTLAERAAWATAAFAVLGVQYHLYLYWNQAQRESFCDWFLLPSLALQLASPAKDEKGAARRVVAIAALSTITWFGKPSFALFTVGQLAVLMIDREVRLGAKKKLALFVVGGALGAAVPLAFLLRYGDAAMFARISLTDVPRVYRFIWAKSVPEMLGEEGPIGVVTAGLATSALLVALVLLRELPRRVLALAFAPLAALAGVLAQHKGFGYHFHPLTATTHMGWLVVAAMLWERFRSAPRHKPLGRYVALGVVAALALDRASAMKGSPHTRNVWILAGGETPYRRGLPEYFNTFKSHDFFPWELREGASYLAEKTSPNARVQVYGMDPYLLFLARRRSATPYIYAYDLNADAALDGGWQNRPTEAQIEVIKQTRDEHERDMLARLKASPPEAFVFIDRAPLISYQDAWEDFRHCCSESATWLAKNYHPARSFGEVVHVWLRDDSPVPDAEGLP